MSVLGYSGHKHQTGQKTIGIVDEVGNVVAPATCSPVNKQDIVLLECSLADRRCVRRNIGLSVVGIELNGDPGVDSKKNRKAIWNAGMKPNILENPRRRDTTRPKRGCPRYFNKKSYPKRFTVERTFGWEDTYRSLVIRYDRKSSNYRGRKLLAYTLINLRWFCGSSK